jgi:phage recombination protein Bet
MSVPAKTNGNGGKLSILQSMATRYNMEASPFEKTLRATVVPDKCTPEQFAAFLVVAYEYSLNPLTKEIYCFPKQGGGIIPVVSIDGWVSLCQSHKSMNGMKFDDHLTEDGEIEAITCKIYRKDRDHPTEVTEYMDECNRNTDPWKKWPKRMLRHKAMIQCARYAFGFSGIYDQDEAERLATEPVQEVQGKKPPPPEAEEAAGENKRLAPPPEVDAEVVDPEAVLKLIDSHLSGATDIGSLKTIWDTVCFDIADTLTFPSDKIEVEKLYEKHEKRVSK